MGNCSISGTRLCFQKDEYHSYFVNKLKEKNSIKQFLMENQTRRGKPVKERNVPQGGHCNGCTGSRSCDRELHQRKPTLRYKQSSHKLCISPCSRMACLLIFLYQFLTSPLRTEMISLSSSFLQIKSRGLFRLWTPPWIFPWCKYEISEGVVSI